MKRTAFVKMALIALLGFGSISFVAPSPALANFKLQILHASDLEGGVEAIAPQTEDQFGRAPNFAAVVEALEAEADAMGIASVLISAGDNYIPGPIFDAGGDFSLRGAYQDFYQAFFGEPGLGNIREGSGRADISFMAAIGFDASALGNHEFDAGTSALADIIGTDIRGPVLGDVRWLGSQFPYLSANLDFNQDGNLSGLFTEDILLTTDFESPPDDLTAAAAAPKIAQAAIIERDGEMIGVVGGTTPLLEQISSPGDTKVENPGAGTNDMDDLAAVLQPVIDAVIDAGVDKVVLTTHLQQIALEQELIGKLNGVDIVIAGGSDTLLANGTDRLRAGDVADGPYPIVTSNKQGDPALIVSTDGKYSYVGRLVVEFDDVGKIIPGSIDDAVSGAYATDDEGVDDLWSSSLGPFDEGTKGGLVRIIRDPLYGIVQAKDGNIFGKTDVYLDGRRDFVRTQETNLGDLSADANLAAAREVDPSVQVSLKNGGGIRAAIGQVVQISEDEYEFGPPPANPAVGKEEGDISQLDIENSLRFNNELSLLTLTTADLLEILEHGVAATVPGDTPGRFPQVGGISFSFDFSADPNQRIQSAAIIDAEGNVMEVLAENGAAVGDPNRTIRIVTLNFLADGGDGYPFETLGEGRVDTGIGEQQALQDYLSANYAEIPFNKEELPPGQDPRIQNLAERSDTVSAPMPQKELDIQLAGQLALGAAEIVAHDPDNQRLYVTGDGLQVVDFSDPSNPQFIATWDIGETTSVAVRDGVIAAAVPANPETAPGTVKFLNQDGDPINEVTVGSLPDMLTFTPDGQMVLVANEGEPDGGVDPPGTASIIDLSGGVANATVNTVGFADFDGLEDALRAQGVRIFPGKSVSVDMEPEYIAVDPNGRTAFVTLQEANSVGVLDLVSEVFTAIVPLGLKDHLTAGNRLDASDSDGQINLQNWPVFGMPMPDGIASYQADGQTYYITANEGDARDEDERIGELNLDGTAFPDAAILQLDENLGRLKASNIDGKTNGAYERLQVFGTRSFSIWDADGNPVYDSGEDFGLITANVTPQLFNANDGDPAKFDERSDDKGMEPEGVTTGVIGNRTFSFVGLERAGGGVMVYNVSDPQNPTFEQYVFTEGDVAPEGLAFIDADDSPDGLWYLVVANEESANLSVYAITAPLPGDQNGDGVVDRQDVSIVMSFRGQPVSACPTCDINEDGLIGAQDARATVLLFTD
jgi:alkaline phosphatase